MMPPSHLAILTLWLLLMIGAALWPRRGDRA